MRGQAVDAIYAGKKRLHPIVVGRCRQSPRDFAFELGEAVAEVGVAAKLAAEDGLFDDVEAIGYRLQVDCLADIVDCRTALAGAGLLPDRGFKILQPFREHGPRLRHLLQTKLQRRLDTFEFRHERFV